MSISASLPAELLSQNPNERVMYDQATSPRWHVLWTRSNCEQLVHDQLCEKGFEVFLPRIDRWSRRGRGDVRRLSRVPMFPGYLFLRHAMDKPSYIDACKTRGLVRILGSRWDRLAAVPEHEIEAIRTVVQSDVPVVSHPYLHIGQRVRITQGPLADVEGILLESEPKKGLLVLSVHLLRQSVAVEVDCTRVVAA